MTFIIFVTLLRSKIYIHQKCRLSLNYIKEANGLLFNNDRISKFLLNLFHFYRLIHFVYHEKM